MKKSLLLLPLFALLLGVGLLAQGPLTNALNLRVRTDASGYLVSAGAAYTAPDGPLTALGNIRLRTDANGYLLTTTSPSATNLGYFNSVEIASNGTLAWSSTTSPNGVADTGISRGGAGVIALGNGTQGDITGTVSAGTYLAGANGGLTWSGRSSIGTPANGLFTIAQNSFTTVGYQMNMGTAAPTVTSCGTGTVTAHSNNMAGEITPTGASACTVTFGAPNWSFQPFCTVTMETTAEAVRISAISVSAFTVTFTTAGNKFMYTCGGGAF